MPPGFTRGFCYSQRLASVQFARRYPTCKKCCFLFRESISVPRAFQMHEKTRSYERVLHAFNTLKHQKR